MSTASQQSPGVVGPVPRLTPSVAAAIRAAAEAAVVGARGPGAEACGLLIADREAGPEAIVDEVQLLPCAHGAGYRLSSDELEALRARANRVRAVPQRQIVGFVRTWSVDPPGFDVHENTAVADIVPECRWFFLAKSFPDGRSRVRAFRYAGGMWSQAADFELGVGPRRTGPAWAPIRAAARGIALLGNIPPAAAATLAVLAIVLLAWACLYSRPAPPPPDLGMRVGTDGSLLGVSWERQLPGVRTAQSGVLKIDDGAHHREVRLDAAQVANGLVLYRPDSDDVTFHLTVGSAGRESLRGAVRWIDAAGAMAGSAVSAAPDSTVSSAGQIVPAPPHAREKVSEAHLKAPAPRGEPSDGLARFVVKTPNARVTVRRVGGAHSMDELVTRASMRLPAGQWIVHASAPGYESWTGHFLVNRAGPADVFVRLRQLRPARPRRSGSADRLRARNQGPGDQDPARPLP